MKQAELDCWLAAEAEPSFRAFSERIIPRQLPLLGVRVPKLRQLAKQLARGDWQTFLALEPRSFEQTMLDALVLTAAPMPGTERLARTRAFLPAIDNWCVCDTLCSGWRPDTPATAAALWSWCKELLADGGEFPMRVGVVMIMDRFRDREHLEEALGLLTGTHSETYYYRMGQAWALSFFYIAFPAETEEAMFSGRLDAQELRMTVAKIGDSYRVPAAEKQRLRTRQKEYRGRSLGKVPDRL